MNKPFLGIIANQNAGRLRHSKRAIFSYFKKLASLFETHIMLVSERGEAFKAAQELIARRGVVHLLAVGGDGTASEVMHALLGQEQCVMSILPAGTANVFARDRGIPYHLDAHFRYMARHKERSPLAFYPGEARTQSHSLAFLQMAGTGIDAAILAHTPFGAKKRWGVWAYCFQAVRISKQFGQRKRVFTINNKDYEGYGLIALTNRFYGGGFAIGGRTPIAPDKLRFVILKKKGMMGLIDLALFSFGIKLDSLSLIEAERACFEVNNNDFTELDGDDIAVLSYKGKPLKIFLGRSKNMIRLYCDVV